MVYQYRAEARYQSRRMGLRFVRPHIGIHGHVYGSLVRVGIEASGKGVLDGHVSNDHTDA